MNKLFRFFNQNRKQILIIVITIVLVISVIQILNNIAIEDAKAKSENISSKHDNTYDPSKSAISEFKVSQGTFENNKEIVSNFVEYCNNKDIQKAYEFISKDCKEELYPTVEDFKKYYYDSIFTKKRTVSIQNWTGSIYIVRYTEDILSTGNVNEDSTVQDYVKILEEDGKTKLSINNYFGNTDINKENTKNGITVKVVSKKTYMDYEIYNFEVENNSGDAVILDTLITPNKTYLTDSKGTKHFSINNEITKEMLIVKDKYKSNISIKFDNPYIMDRKIKTVTFSNVAVCNENNYLGDFKDFIKLSVDL